MSRKKSITFFSFSITVCREACVVFAKDGDSHIRSQDIGTVMRAIGYSPTEAEVRSLVVSIDRDGKFF